MMIIITQTEAYLTRLRSLIEPGDVLEKHGYITRPLTNEELLLKRRCIGCGKALSQLVPKQTKLSKRSVTKDVVDETIATITSSALSFNEKPLLPTATPVDTNPNEGNSLLCDPPAGKPVPVPVFRCKYHPGQVLQKYWTCCFQHVTAKPCGGSNTHVPRPYIPGELAKQYQFHPTPEISTRRNEVRAAVALDCEMGTAISGDSELIRVTLIDYFSGAVLVNNIVEPDVPMQHLNTRFSGVSWEDVWKARREGSCLKGKKGARRALWRYVGPKTVVVGHGASNDLRALRWIHGLVVDSFVTEFGIVKRDEAKNENKKRIKPEDGDKEGGTAADVIKLDSSPEECRNGGTPTVHICREVPDEYEAGTSIKVPKKTRNRGPGLLSLKTLVEKHLHREIQTGGKSGHDSLEDAIAARDLVHWIITNLDHEQWKTDQLL